MPAPAATSTKKSVLFLTTATNIGGMERVVCGLAREFGASGSNGRSERWVNRCVFPEDAKTPDLIAWCRAQGVEAEGSKALLGADRDHHWTDVRELARFIRTADPDVVNLHYGDNFISLKDTIAARLGMGGGARLVITVNHPTAWNAENEKKRKLTRLAAKMADAVVSISHATSEVLYQAGIPKSKVAQISCGLRPPARTFARDEARVRLGLRPDAFVVGTLARLERHKGIGDLISASSRIQIPDRDFQLAIAGKGEERPKLEMQAAECLNGRATFLGRVADTDEFYSACDVFALPSYLEGFGLVYVEAAFHGVPSIGTNAGGIPDAVENGKTGILIPPGDIEALAGALARLRDDATLREELGANARDRANREFTEAVMADRYESVFCGP
ncbi:MAG TPA: glycosyltransferase family 4 protein [Armatimonadaceae bacterium]|nr:glycosyltransferase family 4 protein [Armatimonadaceae bacterium]